MIFNLLNFSKRYISSQLFNGLFLVTFFSAQLVSPQAYAFSLDESYESALQAYHQEKYQDSIIHLKNALTLDKDHLPSKVLMAENLLAQGKATTAEVLLKSTIESGADKVRIMPLLAKSYLLQTNYQNILAMHIPDNSSAAYRSIMQTYVGFAYLGQRHYASAIQSFDLALTLEPSNENALLGLAKVNIAQEDIDQALIKLQQVLTIDDENTQALLMIAIVYKLKNDVDSALNKINQLIAIDKDNYSALLTRAMLFSSQGEDKKAIADLDEILLYYPNEPIANYIRLITESSEGREGVSKKVQLHLMTILSAIPAETKNEQPVFLFLTGLVNFQNNAMENAQKSLLRYHQLAPEDIKGMTLLARAEMALGDYYAAKKYLVKAHLLDETNVAIISLLGRSYMMIDELTKAAFYFNKAIQAQPNNLSAIIDLATLHLLNEDFSAIKTLLEPATNIQSTNQQQRSQVYAMLLKALQKLALFNLAQTYSEQFIKLAPTNSYAHQVQGTLLARQGKLLEAKQSFERAIALDENNFQAVMYLARTQALLGNVNLSISLLQQALAKEPNSALYIELGDVYYGIKDSKSSLTWYQKALAHNPSSILALNKIVSLYTANNDLDAAITVTEDYVQKFDDNPQVYKLLAKLYQSKGSYAQAMIEMNRFVKLSTDKADAYYQLAQLQIVSNAADLAEYSLQKSIAWQRDYQASYLLLLSLHNQNKAEDQALTLINNFATTFNNPSLVSRLKADLFWALGQNAEASNHYQSSYQANANREALLGLYRIYRSNNQYKKITALLEAWLKNNNEDLTLAISLAENYRQMDQLTKANKQYQALLIAHHDNPVILNNAANVLRELTQYEQALKLINKAEQLMPKNVTILDTKAWIEYHKANFTGALALLRKANTLEYNNAEVKYHLAATLTKLDRHKEAKKFLKESIKSPQEFPEKAQARELLKSL